MTHYCSCGCGKILTKEGNRFIKGHHMKGREVSDETKERMSKAKTGENHPLYGKNHSEKSKEKMSDSRKALWGDEEFTKKMLRVWNRKRREERNA